MTCQNNEKKVIKNNFAASFFRKNLLNLRNFNKFLFVALIVLGVSYIAGANGLAIRGYALSDLKEQRNKLAEENKKLELKAMTLSSYNTIGEKIENLKMVAVGSIDYINGGSGAVAKR